MILWYKAPVARVGRVVTVVAHHPVIVHFESITGGWCPVDVDGIIFYLQIVFFVSVNDSFIQLEVFCRKIDGDTFFGYPNRAKIVEVPAEFRIAREDVGIAVAFGPANAFF